LAYRALQKVAKRIVVRCEESPEPLLEGIAKEVVGLIKLRRTNVFRLRGQSNNERMLALPW
jgi:hypothetical protein